MTDLEVATADPVVQVTVKTGHPNLRIPIAAIVLVRIVGKVIDVIAALLFVKMEEPRMLLAVVVTAHHLGEDLLAKNVN